MIIPVDEKNISDAARIHSISWKESHRAFCTPGFIETHTPERQLNYMHEKMKEGTRFFMLIDKEPVGIVSVTDSLIEDLYVLPQKQKKGYGTKLLMFAVSQCTNTPSLWILENNAGAERLYCRMGFMKTGKTHSVTNGFTEIEFALK